MTQAIASHYDLAQRKIKDGLWHVDVDLGLIYGVKGLPFRRVNSWGYIQVKFRRSDDYRREVHVLAHRVIWEHANGSLPLELQINHTNGIKLDNRLVNLEAVTQSQNMQHAFDTGLNQAAAGVRNSHARLTEDQVLEIYRRARSGVEREDAIGLDYGVGRSIVSNIRNGWAWTAVTGHIPNRGSRRAVGEAEG